MGFQVTRERRGEREVYTLADTTSGATASILPSYGFNLFDLRLPAAGQVRPILSAAPDFAEKPAGAGGNGWPVLFPFPNRIDAGKFTFGGKSFSIEPNHGPHAIHGFALDAPWEVADQGEGPDGAFLVGRYQISRQTPDKLAKWPADAILELKYTLAGRGLSLDATIINPGDSDLPYGLGFHPYFHLPLTPGGDLSKTRVILPVSQTWTLREDLIPTGERADVLTGVDYDETGHATCRLIDEALGAEVRLVIDQHYRELVVYTPPPRPGVISVEPYTQTTDAINLHAKGVDGGLRVLGPGASETLHLRLETVDA
jgi:aldose 1-epimerase